MPNDATVRCGVDAEFVLEMVLEGPKCNQKLSLILCRGILILSLALRYTQQPLGAIVSDVPPVDSIVDAEPTMDRNLESNAVSHDPFCIDHSATTATPLAIPCEILHVQKLLLDYAQV